MNPIHNPTPVPIIAPIPTTDLTKRVQSVFSSFTIIPLQQSTHAFAAR